MKRLESYNDGFYELDPGAPKRTRESEGTSNGGQNLLSYFDFEKYRSSVILRKDDIWAVRDDYGMPRRYVLVERDGYVNSVSVRYLKYNRRVAYQRYKKCGVLHSCGIFVVDSDPEPLDHPAFSHKVVGWGNKKTPSKYTIFPRKGEVWAITKCTLSMFGFASPSLLKYRMVEVLEDYNPEQGVKVISLIRVKGGYRSLFQRCPCEGGNEIFCIGSQNSSMDWFSHQVPYFRFPREKSVGDFLELDVSCLPLIVDDFEGGLVNEINDNYLFLAILDRKVRYRSGDGYIWAAYDHQWRVPVKYVVGRPKKVHSRVKLAMHELVSCPIYENEKRWRDAGLPIACGSFITRPVESEKHFILSHRVRFRNKDFTLDSGSCCIQPLEGDVWGIHKDLDTVRSHTPKGMLQYQIVTIVGRNEEGITVAYLVRVEGFRGLFRKKSGHANQVQALIPPNESYRFSHRIPSYRFDGRRTEFLKGAFVLDPLLVPKKDGECFSFDDPFLLERSEACPLWSAILYIVDKQRNAINLDDRENAYQKSECYNMSWTKDPKVFAAVNVDDGKLNLGEISPTAVREIEVISPKVEHEIIQRNLNTGLNDFEDPMSTEDFEVDQIWALHNEFDGLPNFYARINKFTTTRDVIEVTLLEPHPMSEEEMLWVGKKFPMACGTFKTSQYTCIKEIACFSHRVTCVEVKPREITLFWHRVIRDDGKMVNHFYEVFPQKGEVWAIYKHWNIHWTCSDMKNNCKYKLVEVVSDFTEESGVAVAALDRVEGHEDIFRRQLHEDFGLYKTFKRNELLRFSHRIPSIRMAGHKDCSSSYEGQIKIKFRHIGI